MTALDMIEILQLNEFFKKKKEIFNIKIENDYCGFEKWLQLELANHLLSEKLFENRLKITLEKSYCLDGKMTCKQKNFVDLSFTEAKKTKSSTDIEIKISNKPSVAICGLIKDLNGIRKITKTSWEQRAIVGIALYQNKYEKNVKYKKFIDSVKNGDSDFFFINTIKGTNYEYMISAWKSSKVKDMGESRKDYIRYFDNIKDEFKRLIKSTNQ